jgi:putative ABC transport system permease protein
MGFGRRFRRLVALPSRDDRAIARDVDDELAFHLDMRTRELMARGVGADEARARARAEFGDVAAARRRLTREDHDLVATRRRATWREDFWSDVRFALRQLRRSPSFTVVAVITLALGSGASTAIMSVVRGVVLRPLPFANEADLVAVYSATKTGRRGSLSVPDFIDFRASARSFAAIAAYYETTGNMSGAVEPERLGVARVDANWFALLGVRPVAGRTFAQGEDVYGAARVAVIGEGLWRRMYGGDPGAVGRTMTLDGNAVEIVGVVPTDGEFPEGIDLWMTTRFDASDRDPSSRGARWIRVIGRLRDGATAAQANDELVGLAKRIEIQDPRHNTGYSAQVIPLREALVGSLRRPLFVLLGAAGVLLVIACINVAGLLLARAVARDTELAVRTAIGAGRGRIVRQLVTEAVVLSVIAAVLGLAISLGGVRLLIRLAPEGTPRLADVRVDRWMFLFTLGVGIATGLLFGLLPALQGARSELQSRLKEAARGAVGKSGVTRVRRVLVVAELALAVMLLAGAGLLLRSFARLSDVHLGFDASSLTAFTVVLPEKDYALLDAQRRFVHDVQERIRVLPGVRSVGATFGLPLSSTRFSLSFTVEGRPEPPPDNEPTGQVRVATPEYFRTMGIPLLRGRGFTDQDRSDTPQVVLISDALARKYFPNEDPIGKRIFAGWRRDGKRFGGEIIGVVGDVRQFGPRQEPPPAYYAAAEQWPTDEVVFVVKSATHAAALVPALRTVIREVDRKLPVFDVQSGNDLVWRSLSEPRFYLLLLGGFAISALVLGGVGIYGVIAYTVRQRTREIGVRMALGATSGRILRMVVGEGAALAAVGVVLGLVGALQLTGILKRMLYGVEPNDAPTLAVVALLLALVAVLSCLVPARAAARVSPQGALRAE